MQYIAMSSIKRFHLLHSCVDALLFYENNMHSCVCGAADTGVVAISRLFVHVEQYFTLTPAATTHTFSVYNSPESRRHYCVNVKGEGFF